MKNDVYVWTNLNSSNRKKKDKKYDYDYANIIPKMVFVTENNFNKQNNCNFAKENISYIPKLGIYKSRYNYRNNKKVVLSFEKDLKTNYKFKTDFNNININNNMRHYSPDAKNFTIVSQKFILNKCNDYKNSNNQKIYLDINCVNLGKKISNENIFNINKKNENTLTNYKITENGNVIQKTEPSENSCRNPPLTFYNVKNTISSSKRKITKPIKIKAESINNIKDSLEHKKTISSDSKKPVNNINVINNIIDYKNNINTYYYNEKNTFHKKKLLRSLLYNPIINYCMSKNDKSDSSNKNNSNKRYYNDRLIYKFKNNIKTFKNNYINIYDSNFKSAELNNLKILCTELKYSLKKKFASKLCE